MRLVRTLTIVTGVSVLALSLTGCDQVSGLLGQVTSPSSNVSLSLSGLPTSWPAEVAVVDGTITGGAQVNDGWTALVKTTSTTALSDAQQKLQSAGFVVQSSASSNGTGVVTMLNARYQVTLTGSNDGVLYVIAPAR